MFLALSKVLDLALEPLAWVLALALLALATRRARPRAALAAAVAAPIALWAASTEVAADALGGLAERDARDTSTGQPYDAVVVLGGAMEPEVSEARGTLELNAAADRYVAAFELLRVGRARVALLSAGTSSEEPGAPREAELAARMLARWGVDPARVVVEARSRNTRENALECARIVRERGWRRLLLVTSAAHLPRALGCFRAVGLEPDTLPVDFRSAPQQLSALRLLPRSTALAQSATALRELGGRVVYRAVGYSR